ncbi:protein SPO16 homolog [Hyla sarda]|uniref:protein SPO16 homolog n=1 Tax=Hyla sarda TaxID=327740 RepID=UPI0024C3BE8F|nr:protein SPO16 homolog [Hyla sarda]XP_056379129.1 protein SPO16 homolog [Hyla sarda]
MAAQDAKTVEDWRITVIVSSSLQDHEVVVSLRSQCHKIRVSQSVQRDSIIFPLSGIAFLLANAQEAPGSEREEFFDKIQQFASTHRNSFMVIVSALHGPEEWDLMHDIQLRFLGSNLKVIPAHNSMETVKSILTIAKATCKPHLETIQEKLLEAKISIAENSPVWTALNEM